MSITTEAPLACMLPPGQLRDRLASIRALARDALRHHEQRGLVLELRYAPEARDRVREMVRGEQACCSFLSFDLREEPDEVRLIITAPASAHDVADALFEHFIGGAAAEPACTCNPPSDGLSHACPGQRGARAASIATVTLSVGAVPVVRAAPFRSLCLRSCSPAPAGSLLGSLARMSGLRPWRSSRFSGRGAGSPGKVCKPDPARRHQPWRSWPLQRFSPSSRSSGRRSRRDLCRHSYCNEAH